MKCLKCETKQGPFYENGYHQRSCRTCAEAYNKQVLADWKALVGTVKEVTILSAMIEQGKAVPCFHAGGCNRPGTIMSPSGETIYCQEHSTCACPKQHSIAEFVRDTYGIWVCPTVIEKRKQCADRIQIKHAKQIPLF